VRILHRDERLLAVDKPAGLSVHRGWDRSSDVAMTRARDAVGQHVWPVHRLDRSASGVLLFALDREAARLLQAMFAGGEVGKTYLALVRGTTPEEGVIDHPLARGKTRVDAVTAFRRLRAIERNDLPRSYSLVEVRPKSGRLHQIRRHFKHLSHPLVGDVRYGKGEHNRLFRTRFGLQRLFLHACSLELVHPFSRERLALRAELPDELAAVIEALFGAEENSRRGGV
jgi:tRNA pseudouridine65 synthase